VSTSQDHYSYTFYADRANAQRFDESRFGGPIGDLVASQQAKVLANFVGRIKDRVMLDVGTGTGRAALLFAVGGARVTGVDASEQMLSIARQRAAEVSASVTFLQCDAHALTFPERAFDVVMCLRVLMHTPRWAQCVSELSERLVILDYPSVHSTALLQSWLRRLTHALGARNEPYRVFSDREIADALRRGGFRVNSTHRQFVLPIALHKAIGSRRFTLASERLLRRIGFHRLFGSPVTLIAERCVIS
jgi:SAM-dependent methyltransferase